MKLYKFSISGTDEDISRFWDAVHYANYSGNRTCAVESSVGNCVYVIENNLPLFEAFVKASGIMYEGRNNAVIEIVGGEKGKTYSPVCAEDFCEHCGDCLACFGEDDCLYPPKFAEGQPHLWDVSGKEELQSRSAQTRRDDRRR